MDVTTILTGDVDYMSGPFNVTILAAEMGRALLDIEIFSDDILEEVKSFSLIINPSSLPNNVVAGDLDQAVITIEDDSGNLILIMLLLLLLLLLLLFNV